MPFTLRDLDAKAVQAIYKAVLFINPAAPKSCQISFQRFRFPYAFITVALNIIDKQIYTFQCFLSWDCQTK